MRNTSQAISPATRVPDPNEVEQFRSRGYVVLRNAVDTTWLEALESRIRAKARAAVDDADGMARAKANESGFFRLDGLARDHEEWRDHLGLHGLGALAAAAMGCDRVRLWSDHILIKPPGGDPTPWHTDKHFIPIDTDDVCAVWFPLRSVTVAEGALGFVPDSHRVHEVRQYPTSKEASGKIMSLLKKRGIEPSIVDFGFGDCSLHYASCVHGTVSNEGTRDRTIVSVFFCAADARIVPEPENDFHRARWPVARDGKPGETLPDRWYPVV